MMADLVLAERRRLIVLVGRLRKGVILPAEEQELRALIGTEFPDKARVVDQEGLGNLGLGMMGAWYLFKEEPFVSGLA